MSIYDQYEIVVGLEIHAQLNTKSKIFAPDSTQFGAAANEQTSFITLAHPGTLPKINRKVIEYAIKIGLATHGTITKRNEFARKNYFYPDLPKGYQITQFNTPISMGGYVDIVVNQASKRIRLHHIHLEEDAGKSIHDQDPKYSQIDLNRAGVPLVEIVSEPDIRSAEEAYEYFNEVRKLVTYLGICDGNMEEGSLRCDANVSVRKKGVTELGQRTEIKNLNSLRFLKKAIQFEAKRQIDLIESGGEVVMQTRKYDPAKDITFSLRSKEMAHDYRYFPEPDLPPVIVTKAMIERIQSEMPELPEALKLRYVNDLGLSAYDAGVLTSEKQLVDYYESLIQHTSNYKAAVHWLTGIIKSWLNKESSSIETFPVGAEKIAGIIQLIEDKKISQLAATQQLFPALVANPTADPNKLAEKLNLILQKDDDFLLTLIHQSIEKYPDKAKAYKKGKKNLIGLFMGEVMRAAKGKADPQTTRKLLMEVLSQ